MSVTVVTTLGNTYQVANGKNWLPLVTAVGVEGVTVYDGSAPGDDPGSPGNPLALFGPAEAVYVDGAAVLVQPPTERKTAWP